MSLQLGSNQGRRRPRTPPGSTGPAASGASRHPLPSLVAVLSAPERRSMPHLHPERLNGALWFKYDDCIRKDIVATYQSNFYGPWWNLGMVPQEKKDAWWTCFVQKYYWEQAHHNMVFTRYEKILQLSIGDIVSKRKRSGKKPDFIGLTDWNSMLDTWEEEEHVKRSKTNSQNASSNPDGLGSHRHTSGAKNHVRVAHEMALTNGGVPRPMTELVRKTHTLRDGTVIDARAKAFVTAAETLAAERSQQSTATDGTNSGPSVEQLNAAYIESATTKKGRVYGLGSVQDIDSDPKISAADSTLRKAQLEVRVSGVEGILPGLKQGVDVLLKINGVDPVTFQPVGRESGGSAQSPRSEGSRHPTMNSPSPRTNPTLNSPSPRNDRNLNSPINHAEMPPQSVPHYFEEQD